jgi:hypothetical protein
MASQRGLLGNVVRDVGTPRNGEPDDQAEAQGRGEGASGRARAPRKRRPPITEKGKGRNIKIPDGLYDQYCVYARKTKVKTAHDRRVNGVSVGIEERTRCLTVSEAICRAMDAYQPAKRFSVVDQEPPASDKRDDAA